MLNIFVDAIKTNIFLMPKDKYLLGFKWLSVYQITGGIIGIAFSVPLFFSGDLYNISTLIIFAGFLLHSFSVYCGVMLFRLQQHSVIMSLVCQCLQAVSIYGFGIFFQFVSGFSFSLYLESLSGSFHIQFGSSLSSYSLQIGDNLADRVIGFNFVALGIIFVLYYELKAIAREKKSDLINSIGS